MKIKATEEAIRVLDTLMQKKWDALRKKLPYGLAWLTQSRELLDWYENKKKKICNTQ